MLDQPEHIFSAKGGDTGRHSRVRCSAGGGLRPRYGVAVSFEPSISGAGFVALQRLPDSSCRAAIPAERIISKLVAGAPSTRSYNKGEGRVRVTLGNGVTVTNRQKFVLDNVERIISLPFQRYSSKRKFRYVLDDNDCDDQISALLTKGLIIVKSGPFPISRV